MCMKIFDTIDDFIKWRKENPFHEITCMTTFELKLIVMYKYKVAW